MGIMGSYEPNNKVKWVDIRTQNPPRNMDTYLVYYFMWVGPEYGDYIDIALWNSRDKKFCKPIRDDDVVTHWAETPVPPKFVRTRRHVSAQMKLKVLKRDLFKCVQCECQHSTGNPLEIDHIIPFSRCGPDDLSNLQILCRNCNYKKSTKIVPSEGCGYNKIETIIDQLRKVDI